MNAGYVSLTICEESQEMFGMIVFGYALMSPSGLSVMVPALALCA
jgi:hypothetical protein